MTGSLASSLLISVALVSTSPPQEEAKPSFRHCTPPAPKQRRPCEEAEWLLWWHKVGPRLDGSKGNPNWPLPWPVPLWNRNPFWPREALPTSRSWLAGSEVPPLAAHLIQASPVAFRRALEQAQFAILWREPALQEAAGEVLWQQLKSFGRVSAVAEATGWDGLQQLQLEPSDRWLARGRKALWSGRISPEGKTQAALFLMDLLQRNPSNTSKADGAFRHLLRCLESWDESSFFHQQSYGFLPELIHHFPRRRARVIEILESEWKPLKPKKARWAAALALVELSQVPEGIDGRRDESCQFFQSKLKTGTAGEREEAALALGMIAERCLWQARIPPKDLRISLTQAFRRAQPERKGIFALALAFSGQRETIPEISRFLVQTSMATQQYFASQALAILNRESLPFSNGFSHAISE
ncbi:MAG: hypothetical protein DWQ01_02515 [Planctomycetota bacterium]|nr:MAG: hypothetical protein DWQ01_02515 [Planctomycetota bacterium]